MSKAQKRLLTFEEWEREMEQMAHEAEEVSEEEMAAMAKRLDEGDLSVLGPEFADPKQAQKLINEICERAERMLKKAEELSRQRKKKLIDKAI